ncbi:MAG: hypothetical protein HQM15_11970 [Deltaproteobacteria bacterium]|nr:hypothetical protein [Deltaproteobacteria bacterium]
MENSASQLKKKLMLGWDTMKDCYPLVVDRDVVAGDPVKTDFLSCIEGLKSADEIRQYFTLDQSEAHLIFRDLLDSGAIRFLEATERFTYLKQQRVELERQLEFVKSESVRLSGESCYLVKQIKDREIATEAFKQRIPQFEEGMKESFSQLSSLKEKSVALWDVNAELFGLSKEVKDKSARIKAGLEKLDRELPLVMKRKIKVADRLKKVDEWRHATEDKNKNIENRLVDYHDALGDVREHLLDVKMRVGDLSEI